MTDPKPPPPFVVERETTCPDRCGCPGCEKPIAALFFCEEHGTVQPGPPGRSPFEVMRDEMERISVAAWRAKAGR